MPKVSPFSSDPNGIVKEWIDNDDGTYTIRSQQSNESDILERNKTLYTHNDGYTPSRDIQRVASIPLALIEDYMARGINLYAPENEYFLARILDDSDFRHLRTAPGQLGKKHRHI
jgi:hypothetical protein